MKMRKCKVANFLMWLGLHDHLEEMEAYAEGVIKCKKCNGSGCIADPEGSAIECDLCDGTGYDSAGEDAKENEDGKT